MRKSRPTSVSFVALLLLGAACSASGSSYIPTDDGGSASDSAGGHDDGATTADGGSADSSAGDTGQKSDSSGDSAVGTTLHGRLVNFQSGTAIAGGTVSGGGNTATSDATGVFDLAVALGIPFTATATAATYTKLIGQEIQISASVDFGTLPMISAGTTSVLRAQLTGYDAGKGALIVLVVPSGACASEGGATLSVSPAGTVVYFSGGFPSASATSVAAGQAPSAVIYNIPPGVALTLSVTSSTCSQTAYPVTQGALTYTGAMQVEAGASVSAAKIFLQ